jgi:phenylpropionate dioxygenase-like ring-hydroxylating dioxygenase large terminal subunit
MTLRDPKPRCYPTHCWYVAATAEEVTRSPLARRALDTALVLYRTVDGTAVALEDRDAHRPFPLSLGRVEGDLIVSAYSGFAYAPDGQCVRVPTQPDVPYGARVRALPVREQDGLVWVWFGDAGRAGLQGPPRTPWLVDDSWTTIGNQWTTDANYLFLHENFADISHVAVVDPVIAPPALSVGPLPRLDVEVSERSVSFCRDYPPASLAPWHAALLEVDRDTRFRQREEGRFVAPGLWVDSWTVLRAPTELPGHSDAVFRFTHAVTPVDERTTRHAWRVSRSFAPAPEASATLLPLFTDYYERVRSILETMQAVLDADGPRETVNVAADAAVLQVRKIIARMLAEERPAGRHQEPHGSPSPVRPATQPTETT